MIKYCLIKPQLTIEEKTQRAEYLARHHLIKQCIFYSFNEYSDVGNYNPRILPINFKEDKKIIKMIC